MARTTSTQRGASRRSTTPTARGGSGKRATTTRTRSAKAGTSPRSREAAPRSAAARRPAGPWLPVIIVGIVFLLGWSLYPALRLQYQASRRQAGLYQQYDSLKARNEALRAQVAELKTPAGIEQAAREDLGYAKKGDNVYVVMPSGPSSSGTAATQDGSVVGSPSGSVVQSVLDAIFGVQQSSSTVAP
jgi:cell division protein FtsB